MLIFTNILYHLVECLLGLPAPLSFSSLQPFEKPLSPTLPESPKTHLRAAVSVVTPNCAPTSASIATGTAMPRGLHRRRTLLS